MGNHDFSIAEIWDFSIVLRVFFKVFGYSRKFYNYYLSSFFLK